MRKTLLVIMLSCLGCFFLMSVTKSEALDYMVTNYPKLQLVDVYKSFYQDNYGPGHLLTDTISAQKYFDYELRDTCEWGGPLFELTGEGKNYVRLNMDIVRKGIIPANEYFSAFQNSLGIIKIPDDEYWINEWSEIDSLIQLKNYCFINETADREFISNKLKSRNFPIHHSDNFNNNYNFHYRIISLPEFEKLMEKYQEYIKEYFLEGNFR